MEDKTNMNRRKFLQKLGLGASSALTLKDPGPKAVMMNRAR